MSKKPKLIDWIICDDVRLEVSGKTSIIGMYGSDIVVPLTPMIMPQLCLITKWDISAGTFNEIVFRLEQPDGNPLGPITAKAPHNIKGERLIMHLSFIPFQIKTLGTYRIFLKIDDDLEKKIGEFEIKLAAQK